MNQVRSFTTFLETLHRDGVVTPSSVLCFKGKFYPLLFFSLCINHIRASGKQIATVDLKLTAKHEAQRMLESTFLGQSSIFWLGSLSELSGADQQFWLNYLAVYAGPNTLVCFAEERLAIEVPDAIVIPPTMSLDTIIQIANLLYRESAQISAPFFKKVLQHTESLSLDQVCLLIQYQRVMGKNSDQLIEEILPLVVTPQASLFALSDAIFQKNKKLALPLWHSVRDTFSIQFWLSFWSEQTWRAYWYIILMRAGRVSDAKKIAYRLPYSFIQKVWRQYDPNALIKAHAFLYDIDSASKNGQLPEGSTILDLFCLQLMDS